MGESRRREGMGDGSMVAVEGQGIWAVQGIWEVHHLAEIWAVTIMVVGTRGLEEAIWVVDTREIWIDEEARTIITDAVMVVPKGRFTLRTQGLSSRMDRQTPLTEAATAMQETMAAATNHVAASAEVIVTDQFINKLTVYDDDPTLLHFTEHKLTF